MVKITSIPSAVNVRQTFAITGTADPGNAGETVTLLINNLFRVSGGVVTPENSWRIELTFLQQPGDYRLTLSIKDKSETASIKVNTAPPRLRFTTIPNSIRAEESFTLKGEADGFQNGEQLVILIDQRFEVARPRVQDGKWEATLLFNQAGKRLVELIASEQERIQIELNVQSGTLDIVSRQVWGARPAKEPLTNLINPKRITIHHTFIPSDPATSQSAEIQRMRQVQNGQMDGSQGFSDMGYHYMIMASGRIYEGRPENKRGAHDMVNDGIGVCFDGDYTNRQITNAQFQSAVALCTRLCQRMGISDPVTPVDTSTHPDSGKPPIVRVPRILGHRDRVATGCPGVEGGRTVRLDEIRQAVKQKL
ncbi:MAG: N-acetylmuramoyl-L-alanine amidase [Coleofasciculus sp. Co-bin14]|nr:N-acetylmuramoyl-L-alanine amidase [Coleofasciculus sp. Co-bin14]